VIASLILTWLPALVFAAFVIGLLVVVVLLIRARHPRRAPEDVR
jgi:hypothetical protein